MRRQRSQIWGRKGLLMVRKAESWDGFGLFEEVQNKECVWLKGTERGARVVENCPKMGLKKYTGIL